MLLSSPSLSSSSSVPVSPSTTDFVSQLLLPWYDEEEVESSIPLSGELQRSRSLSDIVEQTEFEDSDVEPHDGAPCEWFSGSPGRMQSTPQSSPSSSPHSTPLLADVTLIGAFVSGDQREDYTPLPLPEDMAVPDLALSDDCVDTTISFISPDSVAHIHGDSEMSATKPPGLRSRRASSVLVSRLGIPGQQIALTSAGVEYAVSQLQVHAAEGATARDERRRLDRVVADAVDVFSESSTQSRLRNPRDIIDAQHNPPLRSDIQTRRPVYEVGRSRSGGGAHMTSMVLLERNRSTSQMLPFTNTAAVDQNQHTIQRQRASSEQPSAPAPPAIRRIHSSTPLSYAAVAAKPPPAPSPRPRVVSEQLSSPGLPVAPEQFDHPLLACRIAPIPLYKAPAAVAPQDETSQATPTASGRTTSWRTRHTSEADNWRTGMLAGNRDNVLNAEFAATPPPMPAAFVPRQPSMGPSMLSVTARAQLRDMADRAGERTDVVRPQRGLSGGVRVSAEDTFWSTPSTSRPPVNTIHPRPATFGGDVCGGMDDKAMRAWRSVESDDDDSSSGYNSDSDGSLASDLCVNGDVSDSDNSGDDEVLLFAERRHSKEAAFTQQDHLASAAPAVSRTHSGGAPADQEALSSTYVPPHARSMLGTAEARTRIQQLGTAPSLQERSRAPAAPAALLDLRTRILQSLSHNMSVSLAGSGSSASARPEVLGLGNAVASQAGTGTEALSTGDLAVSAAPLISAPGPYAGEQETPVPNTPCTSPDLLAISPLSGSVDVLFAKDDTLLVSDTAVVPAMHHASVSVHAMTPPASLYSEVVESPILASGEHIATAGNLVQDMPHLTSARTRIALVERPRSRLLILPPGPPEASDLVDSPRFRRSTAPASPSAFAFDARTIAAFWELGDTVKRLRGKPRKAAAKYKADSQPLDWENDTLAILEGGEDEEKAEPDAFVQPLRRRYDPWQFEEKPSADLEVANRGHQAIPHGLGKHRRAATAAARMRRQTAQGFVGESFMRKRGFTGGRFDVLEADVLLL
ncbi:uncharacterized protein TRAVEDRAFT_52041 [Trametes versicolor FP-101664 SS1]|uniref:uncharacterized protein n=1 Tax=Trametes versicolor (strain FP-101664) TaxID=717944 RepID=UPI0004623C38|nr:uncharacterized protein TRAVEDRAFT_52041 [Trametes versicolor FP-101664 SS1]EIW54333.1 hypothetical protein TRAVEDRAFT_52041 [Trametes versicolor FP-101664 SS1]